MNVRYRNKETDFSFLLQLWLSCNSKTNHKMTKCERMQFLNYLTLFLYIHLSCTIFRAAKKCHSICWLYVDNKMETGTWKYTGNITLESQQLLNCTYGRQRFNSRYQRTYGKSRERYLQVALCWLHILS